MLGLLDHDVLSSIEVPYLPEQYASLLDPAREGNFEAFVAAKREADKFDTEIFEFKGHDVQASGGNRPSSVSITGVTPTPSSIRIVDKRTAVQHRTSQPPSKIHRIEETPHSAEEESLPVPGVEKKLLVASLSGTSTGDSQWQGGDGVFHNYPARIRRGLDPLWRAGALAAGLAGAGDDRATPRQSPSRRTGIPMAVDYGGSG